MTQKGVVKPYVKCIGASSTGVTQSCYLVRFKKYAMLLDCGIYQESDIATNYKKNRELLKKIHVKDIDYIVTSHAHHADHGALIPALYAKGCQAHIYVPTGTTPFLQIMWEDSLKIMQSDCAKLGPSCPPLYSEKDVARALDRIVEVEYNTTTGDDYSLQIAPDITLKYYSANHIIHACQAWLKFQDGYVAHTLCFTGDVGKPTPQPYLKGHVIPPFANVLVGESTYSSPSRGDKAYDRAKDLDKIEAVVRDSNRVLIPVFSLQRCQMMLKVLYDMWTKGRLPKDVQIILDGPLAQKLCTIWPWYMEPGNIMLWENLYPVKDWIESKRLQMGHGKCVVLSSAGMLNAGRAVSWAKALLPDSKNTILFCGYAGSNTVAYNIRHGDKTIALDGEMVPNNANIVELMSFSSHANCDNLMDYYGRLYKYNKLVLVHGEMDSRVEFSNKLKEKLVENGCSSRVICANEDTKVMF